MLAVVVGAALLLQGCAASPHPRGAAEPHPRAADAGYSRAAAVGTVPDLEPNFAAYNRTITLSTEVHDFLVAKAAQIEADQFSNIEYQLNSHYGPGYTVGYSLPGSLTYQMPINGYAGESASDLDISLLISYKGGAAVPIDPYELKRFVEFSLDGSIPDCGKAEVKDAAFHFDCVNAEVAYDIDIAIVNVIAYDTASPGCTAATKCYLLDYGYQPAGTYEQPVWAPTARLSFPSLLDAKWGSEGSARDYRNTIGKLLKRWAQITFAGADADSKPPSIALVTELYNHSPEPGTSTLNSLHQLASAILNDAFPEGCGDTSPTIPAVTYPYDNLLKKRQGAAALPLCIQLVNLVAATDMAITARTTPEAVAAMRTVFPDFPS